MKIKIVSDLHINGNINYFSNIQESKEDYDLLVIAGDISSNATTEINFLKTLSKETVCVAGNHLGYDYKKVQLFDSLFETISGQKSNFRQFSGTLDNYLKEVSLIPSIYVHYLNNSYFKFQDKIIFGGTMYTDFELFSRKKKCVTAAKTLVNDFRNVYIKRDNGQVTNITPQDYINWFNKFKEELEKCLNETTEDIIVVTHFAPSIQSISERYKEDIVSACFASNLEDFIKENPRIKLWIHGHVHTSCSYNIGECKVVCNPFGYIGENYHEYKEYREVIVEL